METIVIFNETEPTDAEWNMLASFTDLYYYVGNPLSLQDLEEAGVQYCKQVTINYHNSLIDSDDANSILTYKLIQSLAPDARICVNLSNIISI